MYGYRFGSVPSWDESTRVAPFFLWNLDVQKKITPKATIGFSVVNVFNNLHPRDDSFISYPYFWRAYSPLGRQVFANYRVTF
ncbi:TonB-dependent receptor [Pseudoxanthomonas sp. z9]|uniref:TonB-dependent receptor n=1 Tax=Pseudoxanthomonas sp. z9 TaxID=2584942 RepID=UPI0011439873